MYQKAKNLTFTAIYILLWARFFFMAWDPLWSLGEAGLPQGLAIYRDWRPFLDGLYQTSGYLMWPIYQVYGLIAGLLPKFSWFPYLYTVTIYNALVEMATKYPNVQPLVAMLQSPFLQQSLMGLFDFLVIVGVIFYRLLNPALDYIYDFLKNLIWNLLIEFSFTKKKEAKYQEALEKRAADLMKLNVEYKNLSKEASMLAHSVITDELTKVYNKRFFLTKIEHEFLTAREKKAVLGIAMVDIDHFKKLNDTYGHLLGDKVLQAVAMVAKKGTPPDCFCCRFGGEEFAIIMPAKRLEEVTMIVSGIHRNLPLLRFEEDANLRTSASFGVCIVDFKNAEALAELKSFEDFIKLADDELYRAKLNGRNRYEVNTLHYDGKASGQRPESEAG